MKTMNLCLAGVALVGSSTLAAAGDMQDLTRPDESDYAEVANRIQPIFEHLSRGDASAVIDAAFPSSSPLYQNVKPQLPNLKSQVGVMLDMYGPASNCERARRGHNGSLLIKLEYLCQHERFVTQWNVTVVKTSTGWTMSQITFADAK